MKSFLILILVIFLAPMELRAADPRPAWQTEWDKTVEAAKKEGKLVAAIPASAELRKAITEVFPKRYPGIEQDGRRRVLAGETSIEEVMRVTAVA